METKIQALHFNATEQLQAFIQKKCAKLEKVYDQIQTVDVVLKVVKPETSQNKQACITVKSASGDCYADKTCDTFEQAVDDSLAALVKQLQKMKEKQREN